MRDSRRQIIIAILVIFLFFPLKVVYGGSDVKITAPSVEDARTKLERLFTAALLSHYSIVELRTEDGRGGEMGGKKTYELRFLAVLSFSNDKLRCRVPLCPELQNYSVNADDVAKTATIAGWLFFEETEQGWR